MHREKPTAPIYQNQAADCKADCKVKGGKDAHIRLDWWGRREAGKRF